MRKLVKAALGLAVAAGMMFVAAPASAAVSPNSACLFGDGCVWPQTNRGGVQHTISYSGSGGTGHCNGLNFSVGSASSTFGNPVAGMVLFPDAFCSTTGYFINTNGGLTNFFPNFQMQSYMLVSK